MQILAVDNTQLTFTLNNTETTSERVFSIDDGTTTYLALVHIDKNQTDTDGDGTLDQLNAKFTLSLINNDGSETLIANKPVKLSEVHSLSMESVTTGTVDLVDWIATVSIECLPKLISKRTALSAWASL